VAGCCKHGNDHSSSIDGREFVELQYDYYQDGGFLIQISLISHLASQ
jgi:hypothetical protein